MILYSLTATFGKLEHETLTLKPGLNIIEAPNEWGKSTWCAFLIAMLYGIETGSRSTKTTIADKERYAPWSGSPMAGRIDLNWDGRDITIERRTKGRSILGDFCAYETETGLAVTELTAANCGQELLGVEKSVFTRAGFLRFSDLPVTQDDALRRRLNALVTTGDESGAADTLAQKLKDLKNRCRLNRSTGLIPQALAQQKELSDKMTELRQLQDQSARIRERQVQLEDEQQALLNHQAALRHREAWEQIQKLEQAKLACGQAKQELQERRAACVTLPDAETADQSLRELRALRSAWNDLHEQMQSAPPAPEPPDVPELFRDLEPEDAVRQAETDFRVHTEARQEAGKRLPGILGILLMLAAIPLCFIPHWSGYVACGIVFAAGLLLWRVNWVSRRRAADTAKALSEKYSHQSSDNWVATAEQYAASRLIYEQELAQYSAQRQVLNGQMQKLNEQIDALTGDRPLGEAEQEWESAIAAHRAVEEASRAYAHAEAVVQALHGTQMDVVPPTMPDTLHDTSEETMRRLSECAVELRQLHVKQGNCQGRMEALGQEANLQQQLDAVNERLGRLENTYAALEIAQSTLVSATAELQRRFSPRISKRTQELFGKLTGGRYQRMTLGEDLSLQAGAQGEDTLHSTLWRSDGTVDQLYLALRLAVAEELTPEAPLILDDALVRFDDTRLASAMQIIQESAEQKQVILFTCQGREAAILNKG